MGKSSSPLPRVSTEEREVDIGGISKKESSRSSNSHIAAPVRERARPSWWRLLSTLTKSKLNFHTRRGELTRGATRSRGRGGEAPISFSAFRAFLECEDEQNMRAHRQICIIQPKQKVGKSRIRMQRKSVVQKDNLVIWHSASSLLPNSYRLDKVGAKILIS